MFALYRVDNSLMKFVLDRPCALWGKNGAVASAARGIIKEDGQWGLGERDLLAQMRISLNDDYAIIDDLVPKGPEILLGRIVSIRGWLRDGYNPLGFRMERVLCIDEEAGKLMSESERCEKKHAFEITIQDHPLIRSIGYLINDWQTAGPFRGALLAEDQWDYFRDKL
jgi:hypothetical protein